MTKLLCGFSIGPLHYVSSRSDFSFEYQRYSKSKNDSPTRRVGETTRLPIDTIFFKPLKKSMVNVIVHYNPGFFFAKSIFKRADKNPQRKVSIFMHRSAPLCTLQFAVDF
jgi:hypothetical protein